MGMKRVLYISHVSWAIIKQRPQFIAEELAGHYNVDVYYKRTYKTPKKDLLTRVESKQNLALYSYQILPFDKIRVFDHISVDFINRIWMKMQMPKFDEYDYVWISSPYTYRFIKKLITPKTKLIYDCMDDYPAFPDVPPVARKHMLEDERLILENAFKVLCSSSYLSQTIQSRANVQREVLLFPNGIKIPDKQEITSIPSEIQEKIDFIKQLPISLLYIGAISEWFDYDMILRALNNDGKLHVVLVGPVKTKLPSHLRMHVLGTVERLYIFELMKAATALIMPFVVNDLIKSVNPVKLYEYIYSGKPVISVRYSETEYFKEFVHLYNGYDEFREEVDRIIKGQGEMGNNNSRRAFIEANTWEKRVSDICKILG